MHKAIKTAAALGLLIWCTSITLPAQALVISSSPSVEADDEDDASPAPSPLSSVAPKPRVENKSESTSESAKHDAEKAAERAKHDAEKAAEHTKELRKKFGSEDQLVVPPLVVKKPKVISTPAPLATSATTGSGEAAEINVDAASKSSEKYVAVAPGTDVDTAVPSSQSTVKSGANSTVGKTDIVSDQPIEISGVNPSAQTPADTFMNAATYGLGAMAAGAAALAAVTLVRGSNRSPKRDSEFTYTSSSN